MLWFDDQAEEAASHYVTVFSKRPGGGRGATGIVDVSRYTEAGPLPAGTTMVVRYRLEGQEFTALNGGPAEFAFSEALSFVVSCETQEEVDYFWAALSEGGEEGPCGWLKDRYGLSWQIVPTALGDLLGDPDRARAERAMAAMLHMRKLDVGELRAAANG
jgi:predicted 3-demethylubiquinone-9 3-methyltransferase (glyoxalase superfamily)